MTYGNNVFFLFSNIVHVLSLCILILRVSDIKRYDKIQNNIRNISLCNESMKYRHFSLVTFSLSFPSRSFTGIMHIYSFKDIFIETFFPFSNQRVERITKNKKKNIFINIFTIGDNQFL